MAYGAIPAGLFVCHRCDNKACVRPDHLFLGTHNDNMQDKKMKGRATKPPGELSPRHRLTDEIVIDVRRKYDEGLSMDQVGKEFGLKTSHVCNIINGKLWPHIPLGQRSHERIGDERYIHAKKVGLL